VRYRPMQPNDVLESVEIIANHPVISSRYGSAIADLPAAWLRMLSCEAGDGWVFQAEEGQRAPICMVGVSVIVNDDFVRELKGQGKRVFLDLKLYDIGEQVKRAVAASSSSAFWANTRQRALSRTRRTAAASSRP